ncbi:MAG TPA: hypothetical protein VF683_06025, partial [Chthoniobacterales bacterium]
IEKGVLTGSYLEWHENGQKAVEMTLRDGNPDGLVQAWHPSGLPKSRSEFRDGKMVDREFFSDLQASINQPTPARTEAAEQVAE